MYVNLVNSGCLSTPFLITLSYPLYPSPGRTSIWSIVWIPFIWSPYTTGIFFIYLQPVRELAQLFDYPSSDIPSHPLQGNVREIELGQFKLFEYSFSDFPILLSLSVSRVYVNLINCLNIVHLITLSHWHPLLYPSPECTWTCWIVWAPHLLIPSHPLQYNVTAPSVRELGWFKLFFWSSHPTLFIRLQSVRELAQLFEYPSSDYPIPSSPGHWHCAWTWSIQVVWILLFWISCATLFIRLQGVRQVNQLFKYRSSDHPIPLASSSLSPVCTWTCSNVWVPLIWLSHPIFTSTPWLYVNLVDSSCFSDHPILPSLSICRAYVNLLNCLNIPHLIFRSHPILSRTLALYVNLINSSCLNTPFLNFLSCPLYPSPVCTWTCSTVWVPLIWLSHPILSSTTWLYVNLVNSSCLSTLFLIILPTLFIRLQSVRQLAQLLEYPSSDFPIPSSAGHWHCTWTRSIQVVWILLFWFSYPTLFIRLQGVRQLDQLFWIPLV